METMLNKYTEALASIPPPGGGGCHGSLLGVANLGGMAGVSEHDVFADIRGAIPQGGRRVPDSEIWAAVRKAISECDTTETGHVTRPHRRPHKPSKPFDGDAYRRKLISRSEGVTEADIWEASPLRIDWQPGARDAVEILAALYADNDIVFVGTQYDRPVAPVAEWQNRIKRHGAKWSHIIPNPVDGEAHDIGEDKEPSYRCDQAVACFRFSVVEFDNLKHAEQHAFWFSIIDGNLLPVAALIDSGGKSIHAWLRVALPDADAWQREIRDGLYHPDTGSMTLLGADTQCKNASRLSRLPGHCRTEKGRWQRLLYLNPS